MKKELISIFITQIIIITFFTSCSSNESPTPKISNCVTCKAFELLEKQIPAGKICKGENGNAFINGEDKGIKYENYITTTKKLTTCK